MTYGRTWHEGRSVRHHNLVSATQPPITGPIDKGKGRSNTAGKGKGKPKAATGGVSQLGALAFNSSAPTVGAATVIPMPSESYDNSGYHSTVTNTSRLTVPSGGRLVRVASGAVSETDATVALLMDGADFDGSTSRDSDTALTDSLNFVSGILSVSGGEYFELQNATGTSQDFASTVLYHSVEELDASTQYALVKHSTTQAINGAGIFAFNTEVADVGGWHDNVTNNSRLTVPSGVTLVRISGGAFSATTTDTQVLLYTTKNGGSYLGDPRFDVEIGAAKRLGVVSPILAVTPGDYFELNTITGTNHTFSAGGGTWFCIEEVDSDIKRALVSRITTNESVTSGDPITWNNEAYDTDGIWDAGGDAQVMTAPAGVSQARFSFGVNATVSTGNAIAIVTRNAATEQTDDPGLPRSETDTFSNDFLNAMGAWVPCSPGDTFRVRLFGASPAAVAGNQTWFCAEFK